MFQNLKKKINSLNNNPVRTSAPGVKDAVKEANENAEADTSDAAAENGPSKSSNLANVFTAQSTAVDQDASAASFADKELASKGDRSEVTLSKASSMSAGVSQAEAPVTQVKGSEAISLEEVEEFVKEATEDDDGIAAKDAVDLQKRCSELQEKSNLYRTHLNKVALAYKEVLSEKQQLQENFTKAADRHRRQVSELKEQSELDYHAKRDLENNYSLLLDEKDEMIQILQMKIRLLKGGSSEEKKESSPDSKLLLETAGDVNASLNETQLREKVKRLELLLTKCKDTIKTNKDKIQQLVTDKDAVSKLVQEKTDELEKLRELSDNRTAYLENALLSAQSKLKTSSLHPGHGDATKERMTLLESQNKELQEKVSKLEKSGEEQLEKSRVIMRQLKEKNHQLEEKINHLQSANVGLQNHESKNSSETDVDQLKSRVGELTEENQKLKSEYEDKLKTLTAQQNTDLEEKLQKSKTEHEKKQSEVDTENHLKITALVSENQKLAKTLKKVEEELHTKLENLSSSKELQIEEQKSERDELMKRSFKLQETIDGLKLNLEDKSEEQTRIFKEKNSLEERIRELEGVVDNKQVMLDQALVEITGLRSNLSQQQDEFRLTATDYEKKIEQLRREIEVKDEHIFKAEKMTHVIPPADPKKQDVNDLAADNDRDLDNRDFDVKIESEMSNLVAASIEGSMDVGSEKPKPDETLIVHLEAENQRLKDSNRRLMDEIEDSKSTISRLKEEFDCMSADYATRQENVDRHLRSATEVITQLEQQINDSMERENQLNMDLEMAKVDNEKNLMLRNQDVISLQETIDRLLISERSLKELNEAKGQEIKVLQESVTELNLSRSAANEKSLLHTEEVSLLKVTLEELQNSEQTSQNAVALKTKELNALKEMVEKLEGAKQTLEDQCVSQTHEIKTLQSTIDQLRSSEKMLKDACSNDKEELIVLQAAVDQLRASEPLMLDENAKLKEEINSLQTTVDQLRTSEPLMLDENAKLKEEINSLQTTVDQLRASEPLMLDENVKLKEEIDLLQAADDLLRSSEQTMINDASSVDKEEAILLQTTTNRSMISDETLRDSEAKQSREISSQRHDAAVESYPSVDNVQMCLTKQKKQCTVSKPETEKPTFVSTSVSRPENKGLGGHSPTSIPRPTSLTADPVDADGDEVVRKLEAEIDFLKVLLVEKEKTHKQLNQDKQALLEKLKALEDAEFSDHKAEMELHQELEQLEEKAQLSLDVIFLMERVKCLEEEVVSLKVARTPSASPAVTPISSPPGVAARVEFLHKSQKEEHLESVCKEQEQKILGLTDELENLRKNFEEANMKLINFEKKQLDDRLKIGEEEIAMKPEDEGSLMMRLEQLLVARRQLEAEVRHLKQEAESFRKAETRTAAQKVGLLGFDVGSMKGNTEFGSLAEEKEINQNRSRTSFNESGKIHRASVKGTPEESGESLQFYKGRVVDLEQTVEMLKEDLAVLIEKQSALTQRCLQADKDVEHFRFLALQTNKEDSDDQSREDQLRRKFETELEKYATENGKLRALHAEHVHQIEILKSSAHGTTSTKASNVFTPEFTELEYLRNILYKYMIGVETKTLAKVICTVVKFSPEETRKILAHEESKSGVVVILRNP